MEIPKIFESEYRFCEILWENEPVSSSELVRLCNEKLEWKKSTTYTVIRRLSERGILKSEGAVVTSLVSREDVQKLMKFKRLLILIRIRLKNHADGNMVITNIWKELIYGEIVYQYF